MWLTDRMGHALPNVVTQSASVRPDWDGKDTRY